MLVAIVLLNQGQEVSREDHIANSEFQAWCTQEDTLPNKQQKEQLPFEYRLGAFRGQRTATL